MKEDHAKIIDEIYQAYIYGYPLVVLELQKAALTNTVESTSERAPINQLIHAKGLASAKDKYIVMLNMDTVYSQVYFDVKKEPIYFYKPKTDRYATALFLDAYGNTIDIIGTGGVGGNEEVNVVLVGRDYKGEIPEGFTKIVLPTNSSWALIRILLENESDIENVRVIQNKFDVRPLSAYGKKYTYPKGRYNPDKEYVTFEKLQTIQVEEFFSIFNETIGDNLGNNPDEKILSAVKKYGIGAGLTFDLNAFDTEVKEELQHLNARIKNDFAEGSKKGRYGSFVDGWILPKDTIAQFGKDYFFRAEVAWGGIGVNPVSMAIYPTAVTDNEGEILHSDHDYVVHFSSLPPVDGFWSLAAYGDDKFQISNEIGRYGINDRSDIQLNEDGSFDLYVQRKRPAENKVNNWIPSGQRGLTLVLRLYLPKQELLDGKWKLPIIKRGA